MSQDEGSLATDLICENQSMYSPQESQDNLCDITPWVKSNSAQLTSSALSTNEPTLCSTQSQVSPESYSSSTKSYEHDKMSGTCSTVCVPGLSDPMAIPDLISTIPHPPLVPSVPSADKREAAKIKKQRRRSAFGTELKLKLQTCVLQDIANSNNISNPSTEVELQADRNDNESVSSVECTFVSVAKTETDNDKLVSAGTSEKETRQDCVEEPVAEIPQPLPPKQKRKRRMSADISVIMHCPELTDDLDLPVESLDLPSTGKSAFRKRRSSIRLCRRRSQRLTEASQDQSENDSLESNNISNLSATEISHENSSAVQETQIGTATNSVADKGLEEKSPNTVDDENTLDVCPELETLYKNKNYKRPADKTWETIFECPSKGKVTSKQKLRRQIQFTDNIPRHKLVKRLKKAALNGWNLDAGQQEEFDIEKVKQKLMQLDEEIVKDC